MGTPSPIDLRAFASAVAARIPPGWAAQIQDLTHHQSELSEQVWDLGTLDGALFIYAFDEAATLTGPDGTRLVAVHRPGVRDQVLVGALRPAALPAEVMDAHGGDIVPLAISVDQDPVRAAAEIQQRLLPRYDQAVWQVRVRALTAAADGIEEASAAWDAVSDSLCDEQGWPLDDAAYEAGKTTRDARAWQHVETFLALGPDLLTGVRSVLREADSVNSALSQDLRRMSGIDTTLARGAEVRKEWEQVTALMDGVTPGGLTPADAAEAEISRNEDGWGYGDELARNGRALADAATRLSDRVGVARQPENQRVRAALSRSPHAPTAPTTTAQQSPPLPALNPDRHSIRPPSVLGR